MQRYVFRITRASLFEKKNSVSENFFPRREAKVFRFDKLFPLSHLANCLKFTPLTISLGKAKLAKSFRKFSAFAQFLLRADRKIYFRAVNAHSLTHYARHGEAALSERLRNAYELRRKAKTQNGKFPTPATSRQLKRRKIQQPASPRAQKRRIRPQGGVKKAAQTAEASATAAQKRSAWRAE